MHLPSLQLRCHLHIVLQGNQGREGTKEEAQGDIATWLYSRLFEADQQLAQTTKGKGDHLALPPFCSQISFLELHLKALQRYLIVRSF
jgi:hypothetical protein